MGKIEEEQFNELKELLSVLKPSETEIAKKHLIAYSTNHTLNSSRSLQLFKLLEKKPDIDLQKAFRKLKYKSLRSFLRLVQRTVSKVEESLILEVNINRSNTYSQLFTTKFKIRKLIMQTQILSARGLTNQSLKLTESILRSAKKFELYDEIIEALYNKQVLVGLKKGEQYYNKMKKDIQNFENARHALNRTKDKYRSFYAASDFSGIVKDKSALLEKLIEEIELDQKETNSINIQVLSHLLKMEWHFLKAEYFNVEITGLDLINILKDSEAVFSTARMGLVYFNIADSQISALDFDKAILYSGKSENVLKENLNFNLLMALECKVLAEFYTAEYATALNSVEYLLKLNVINKFPFKKAKALYFKAINLFITGEYKHANTLLYNITEIEKDKEGWNVWIRILRILCSVEMLRLNLVEYDIENFRKYMIRTAERADVRERDRLVLRVLLELDRQDYDFKSTAKSREKTLEKLASLDPLIKWEPKSPELILFHDWFWAKVENREYRPNFELYREEVMKKSSQSELNSKHSQSGIQQLSLELNVP